MRLRARPWAVLLPKGGPVVATVGCRGLQLVVAYDSGHIRASGRLEQRVPVRVGDLRDVPLRVAHEGDTLTAEERVPAREKVSLLREHEVEGLVHASIGIEQLHRGPSPRGPAEFAVGEVSSAHSDPDDPLCGLTRCSLWLIAPAADNGVHADEEPTVRTVPLE